MQARRGPSTPRGVPASEPDRAAGLAWWAGRRSPTPHRARAVRLAVAGVVVTASALGGCGSGPTPAPSPTVSTSLSPTPTPTTTPTTTPSQTPTPTPAPDASVKPDRPAAMDEVSSAGAEAVAVYFLELYAYVYATNDLTEWRELSHPECIFCASVITNVEEQVAAGYYSVGGISNITGVDSTEIDVGRWWSVDVELIQEPSQTLDSTGHVVEDFPETKSYHMDIAVVHEADQWVIRELSHERTS